MKLVFVAGVLSVALTACASAPKPEPATAPPVTVTSAATDEGSKSAAELWAEKKIAAETDAAKKASSRSGGKDEGGFDPLAMNNELEESSIPKLELTPAAQVRAKSPGELNAAVGVVKSENTVDGAAKKLTQRLGKPNWTEAPKGAENTKRRVWVAPTGGTCQRLILEADGTVEVETASKTEWRMLTASARQNPCTGEIKRGIAEK
jgi:hypothetical protein